MINKCAVIEALGELVVVNQFIASEINEKTLMIICFLTCIWRQKDKCYFLHIVYEKFNKEFNDRKIPLNFENSHYFGEGEFFDNSKKVIIKDNCDFRFALMHLTDIPILEEKMKLIEPLILKLNLPY